MNTKELTDLIKLQLDTGTSLEKVTDFLRKNGLTEEEAERLIRISKGEENLVKETEKIPLDREIKPRVDMHRYWIVFLGMLLLIGTLFLAIFFLKGKI